MKTLLLILATLTLLASCHSTTGPTTPADQRDHFVGHQAVPFGEPVPGGAELWQLRARVDGAFLKIEGALKKEPAVAPDLWDLLIFLDTDQNLYTGYNWGWEYVILPGYFDPAGEGKRTIRWTGPPIEQRGGWGHLTGYATLEKHGKAFVVTIPLAAIADDGIADISVNLFAGDDGWGGLNFVGRYDITTGPGALALVE
jgi:hypothetical protein